jgi:hypothetical protein
LEECRDVIASHLAAARDALRPLPESTSRTALRDVTAYLAQQTAALGVPA